MSMAEGAFILNGIRIGYHLIEAAMEWAKQNEGSLIGVYVYSGEKNAESYGFPSDIEQAETQVTENEGEAELDTLIGNHIQYAEKQFAASNIPFTTHQLKNPDIDELTSILLPATVLFLDPAMFREEEDADAEDLSAEDIREITTAKVIEVSQ